MTTRILSGCDVVDVDRLTATMTRRDGFRDRVFTTRELLDARRGDVEPGSATERARLAARFAAKEATRKALGDLRLRFHDVEVRSRRDGAPELFVRGERSDLSVSLSHDGGVALAVVTGLTTARAIATDPDHVPAGGRVSLDLIDA